MIQPDGRMFEITAALPEHANALVELVSRGMLGYPFESVYDPTVITHSLLHPTDKRIVAIDPRGQVIGTAVLGDTGNHMQEIKRVVVEPTVRGEGIASKMTDYLTKLAHEIGVVPWVDARGCQPGMQKAALNSGFQALSLELGKHCVYWHLDKEGRQQVGPARETMVHLTELPTDFDQLSRQIRQWPLHLIVALIDHMQTAFTPTDKDQELVETVLPSAATVKQRIRHNLQDMDKQGEVHYTNNEDIILLKVGDCTMVVVAPDASGFILSAPNRDLAEMVKLGHKLGLQTITSYVDVADTASIDSLERANLSPTMLRVWQEKDQPPTWQVGWRSVANHFEKSLHYVRLHPTVREQIAKVIARIP